MILVIFCWLESHTQGEGIRQGMNPRREDHVESIHSLPAYMFKGLQATTHCLKQN